MVTGFNCRRFAGQCIESLKRQVDPRWRAYIIDDGSTDGTAGIIETLCRDDHRLTALPRVGNEGACKRRFEAIHEFVGSLHDVVALVGLDDQIMPSCTGEIQAQYDLGFWMSYGSWRSRSRVYQGKPYPAEVHAANSYREVRFEATAINTFSRWLVDEITPQDLQNHDGSWLENCTDCAFMFPCLEQCPEERIAVIKNPIYFYNEDWSGNTLRRLGRPNKTAVRDFLKTMPKKRIGAGPQS